MAKTPETTIATLDMHGSGSLTLTNRHLRGQVVRIVQQGQAKIKSQEQIDVLLSNIAGYSVIDVPMKLMRIIMLVGGIVGMVLLCALNWVLGFVKLGSPMYIVFGVLLLALGVLCFFTIKDQVALELNIMGGKFQVPLKPNQADEVRAFLAKLQEAKTEYEEANG